MAHHIHHKHLQQEKRDISTILSVVYVTASPTFTGAIGGYITLDGSQSTTTQAANNAKGTPIQNTRAQSASSAASAAAAKGTPIQNSRASSSDDSQASSTVNNAVPSRQGRPNASTTSLSTATLIPSADTSDVASTSMLLDTSVAPTSGIMVPATTLISSVIPAVAAISSTASVSSSTASATSSSIAHAAEGTSGGAKAGIAIGVILVLAIIAGLIFFFLRRRRNDQLDDHQHVHNEKAVVTATVRESQSSTNSSTSRFSLTKSVLSIPRLSLGPIMSEKQDRPELRHQDSLSNPFGDHNQTVIPITDSQIKSLVAANVPAPLNPRPTTPNALNSPASARSSPAPPPNNVHRVQLDFKPSMDDELELRSGQLVRLLHEYDDGWALCKSWDRTQQGVVPRSCLSKLPLKPRIQNRSASGRQVSGGHRNVSGGSVSSTASFASEESVPRPLSPAGRVRAQSSASAGPRQSGESTRPRSNSSGDAKALSPLNPAAAGIVVGRKPVPGQAI